MLLRDCMYCSAIQRRYLATGLYVLTRSRYSFPTAMTLNTLRNAFTSEAPLPRCELNFVPRITLRSISIRDTIHRPMTSKVSILYSSDGIQEYYRDRIKHHHNFILFRSFIQQGYIYKSFFYHRRNKRIEMTLRKRGIKHLPQLLPLISLHRNHRISSKDRSQLIVNLLRFRQVIDPLNFIRNSLFYINTTKGKHTYHRS